MGRILLLVLPLCLVLQGQQSIREALPMDQMEKKVGDKPPAPITNADRARHEIISLLALSPATGFPGSVPWYSTYPIGNQNLFTLENILVHQPSLFLQMCLDKQERDCRGYKCVFYKQERVKGKLHEQEKINAVFRERPFSIFFEWQKGQVLARKTLFVEGENNGQMVVLPTFLPFAISEPVDSQRAKDSGFYLLNQFGMKLAMQRTLASMRKAQAKGVLHVSYEGEFCVSQLGGRVCHKFIRSPFTPVEEDGLNELTLYIDKEYWLQVGSILRDEQGHLIAEYYFSDLQLNPEYSKEQFTKKAF